MRLRVFPSFQTETDRNNTGEIRFKNGKSGEIGEAELQEETVRLRQG
jgi:hypothetical protein